MTRDVLNRIRSACADVAAQASFVHIDEERLHSYASTLTGPITTDDGDPGRQRHGDDEATAAFVTTLDAINFGSGYFPSIAKRDGLSGYHTVAAALRDHVTAQRPITGTWLRSIDDRTCQQIFGQRSDGLAGELMSLFAAALRDLGNFIATYDDSFVALVESAGHCAEAMVELLGQMPFYRDVARYRGFDVPLYKRAQITPYDVAQTFGGRGLGRFDDLAQLTMFADNLVPHVLRIDGVVQFVPELVERIERGDDITAGSEPEVEIRAVALHAVELLRDALAHRAPPMTAGEIDSVLWNRGSAPRYKARPRHRSRGTWY